MRPLDIHLTNEISRLSLLVNALVNLLGQRSVITEREWIGAVAKEGARSRTALQELAREQATKPGGP